MKWIQEEKQKLKKLSTTKKVEYIWQYYKLWLLTLVAVAAFGGYMIEHSISANKESQIYVGFVNTYADFGENTDFWDGYVQYSQTDPGKENVIFDTNIYFDMTKGDVTGNYYYEKAVVLLDSQTMDAVVMEKENLTALGASGRLIDLQNEKTAALLETYSDRIVTTVYTDENGAEQEIPVGIDLSDSSLVTQEKAYSDSAVLGIAADAQHIDAVTTFLSYVIKERDAG